MKMNNDNHACPLGPKLTNFKVNSLAESAEEQFALRTSTDEARFFYFGLDKFNQFLNTLNIFSPATNGNLCLSESETFQTITYKFIRRVRFMFFIQVSRSKEKFGVQCTVTDEGIEVSKVMIGPKPDYVFLLGLKPKSRGFTNGNVQA